MRIVNGQYDRAASKGVVYGYTGAAADFVPSILDAYCKALLAPTDSKVIEAAAAISSSVIIPRIMGEWAEPDVITAFWGTMNRSPFSAELGPACRVDHLLGKRPLRGPFIVTSPDWRVFWSASPEVELRDSSATPYRVQAYALALAEVKGTYTSTHAAFTQAAQEACCAAYVLWRWQLPLERCIVPFLGTNGLEEKHGAAYVLSNGLPCITTLSGVCDLTTADGQRAAAQWRLRLCAFAAEQAALLDQRRAQDPSWMATLAKCTQAAMQPQVKFVFGDDFFIKTPTRLHRNTEEQSLALQLQVFQRLYAAEEFVVRPMTALSFIMAAGTNQLLPAPSTQLVFTNMVSKGFTVGIPAATHMRSWLQKLHTAIHAIHAAGVVHLDLHPNNTMFLLNADGTGLAQLVIIDFDSALPRDQTVRRNVIDHVWRGQWKDAYPTFLVADEPPPTSVDWYFLAAILFAHLREHAEAWCVQTSTAPHSRRAVALDKMREMLERERSRLEACVESMERGVDEAVEYMKSVGMVAEDASL